MKYTVQQLADLAGVSVRTLHHYDEIRLLSPAREENGYRVYGEPELLRLQQILFFRELDFSLENIAAILAKPDFDIAKALAEHRVRIEQKRERLVGLLRTIDQTIDKLAGKKEMTDEQLFEGFWKKHEEEYAEEAKERWGNTEAYKQSVERTKHMTKDDFKRIAQENAALIAELAASMESGPASAKAQELIGRHYESLRTFYDPSPELYRGLAEMYVADPRFRANYEQFDPLMPEFMRDAMNVYAEGFE